MSGFITILKGCLCLGTVEAPAKPVPKT